MNNHSINNTAALLGGWGGWKSAGLPTEGSAAPKKN
jgi:3-mercaptopyruvate sulfurtransferase SseA